MAKKPGDKRVGEISGATQAKGVQSTENISGVEGVKPTGEVGAIQGVSGSGKRRPTRTMTLAEREELFRIIGEEADKVLPPKQRELVKNAVKMAVDAGLLPDDKK